MIGKTWSFCSGLLGVAVFTLGRLLWISRRDQVIFVRWDGEAVRGAYWAGCSIYKSRERQRAGLTRWVISPVTADTERPALISLRTFYAGLNVSLIQKLHWIVFSFMRTAAKTMLAHVRTQQAWFHHNMLHIKSEILEKIKTSSAQTTLICLKSFKTFVIIATKFCFHIWRLSISFASGYFRWIEICLNINISEDKKFVFSHQQS